MSWQPNLAARSIATPKPIETRTGTSVIESTWLGFGLGFGLRLGFWVRLS